MSLHTLGLTGNLSSLAGWGMPTGVGGQAFAITAADLAAINQAIIDDNDIATILQGLSYGPQAVIATGTTAGTVTVTAVTQRGATPLPVTQIRPGDLVLGVQGQIVPGTFVVSFTGSTLVMSQAAAGSASGVALLFVRPGYEQLVGGMQPTGQLMVPQRGTLIVRPGDYVAIDNTGWPILLSGAAVGYAGSQWTFT